MTKITIEFGFSYTITCIQISTFNQRIISCNEAKCHQSCINKACLNAHHS